MPLHRIPQLNPSTVNVSGRVGPCLQSEGKGVLLLFPSQLLSHSQGNIFLLYLSSYGLLGDGTNVHLYNLCQQPDVTSSLTLAPVHPSSTLCIAGWSVLSSPSSAHGPTLGLNLASRTCL